MKMLEKSSNTVSHELFEQNVWSKMIWKADDECCLAVTSAVAAAIVSHRYKIFLSQISPNKRRVKIDLISHAKPGFPSFLPTASALFFFVVDASSLLIP